MIPRSSRALILTAIVTVIAYAQCFSDCGFRACEPEQAQQESCHHPSPAKQQSAACSHQHSDFASPEAHQSDTPAPLLVLAELSWEAPLPLQSAPHRNSLTVSPPGTTFVSSPAILRI